jgi:hypothetical protein
MGTIPRHGRVECDVDAPAVVVWKIVTDVTRTGEWSGENQGNKWIDGATSARVGACFRGRNRQGRSHWKRVCKVTALEDERELVWQTVWTWLHPDVTEWHIELRPLAGDRTHVVLRYEILRADWYVDRLYYLVLPAHRDRTEALALDLQRLGAIAYGEPLAALS